MEASSVKTKVVDALDKGKVGLGDMEVDPPLAGEVQVKVHATLISPGTERATILSLENTPGSFPQHLGYSAAGTVERVGEGVTRFSKGGRVACFGVPHAAVGNVHQDYCIALPDGTSFEQGAFVALGVICLQGVRKTRIELGESALVIGLGPIGLLALQTCRAAGALPVIAMDRVTGRLEKARGLGADLVADATHADWEKAVRDATDSEGPHVVIESTGFPQPISTALEIVRKFGRVSLLGSTRGQSTVNFYSTVHRKALSVVGAHVMGNPSHDSRPGFWTWRDDARAFLRLLAAGRILVDPLVTERIPWNQYAAAYDRLLRWDSDTFVSLMKWD
jgi:threonine dehydrogenase-like Zn-dependent dehydrogenase